MTLTSHLRLLLLLLLHVPPPALCKPSKCETKTFTNPKKDGYYFHDTVSASQACEFLGCTGGKSRKTSGKNNKKKVNKIWYPPPKNLRTMGNGGKKNNPEPYITSVACKCTKKACSSPKCTLGEKLEGKKCVSCPAGKAATANKAGTCQQCADGKTPGGARKKCQKCPAGKAGKGGACKNCGGGRLDGEFDSL